MSHIEPLAKKLLKHQLHEIMRPYCETFTFTEHLEQKAINPDIKFDIISDGKYTVSMVFNLKWHEGLVKIKAHHISGEFYSVEIDTFERKASYGELQDAVGTIAYEVYQQLHRYAVDNNFPPENVIH
jgi:hypothetical protein